MLSEVMARRTRRGRGACTFVVVALGALAPAVSRAATLGIDPGGAGPTYSRLVSVDVATGAVTSLFAIGRTVDGLAQNPVDGTWYATTDPTDPSLPDHLIWIDPTTQTSADVGALGSPVGALTFTGAGVLYGWGSALYSIDVATGAATHVGGSSSFAGAQTMTVDGTGVLHGLLDGDAGILSLIDPATGVAGGGVSLSGPNLGAGAGLESATYSCTGGAILAVDADAGFTTHRLVSIDVATGAITQLGNTGDLWAIANDCPANVAMASGAVDVPEAAAEVVVHVDRSVGVLGAAHVDFATASGSATAGADFTAISGTLDFAAGQTSATIHVPIRHDTTVEGPESFTVTLSNAAAGVGATLLQNVTTVTVVDDDHLGISVKVPSRIAATTLAKGWRLAFACNEACTLAGSLTQGAGRHATTIARGTVRTKGAGAAKVRFRLTAAGKRWLSALAAGKAVRLGVVLAARDATGHLATVHRTTRLRR